MLVSFLLDAPCTSDTVHESDAYCVVCGSSSKLYISLSKSYEQVICESCNGFFESFIKTPKQYFCKDGKLNEIFFVFSINYILYLAYVF